MLHEYAVNPDCLKEFGPMWVVMESFGISKGRVVAKFPDHWVRLVFDAVRESNLPDIENHRVLEGLKRLKPSVASISGPRDYHGVNWIEAALRANVENPFHAVFNNVAVAELSNSLAPEDANDSNDLWRVDKPPIPRTAVEIAACTTPLGKISQELLFIDPYLGTDWKRLKVVREILISCGIHKRRVQRVELHVTPKVGAVSDLAHMLAQRVLKGFARDLKVGIYQWQKRVNGEAVHARYFLTERGGICFDYGLSAGNSGETTDVKLLSESTYRLRWENYQQDTAAFDLVDQAVASPLGDDC